MNERVEAVTGPESPHANALAARLSLKENAELIKPDGVTELFVGPAAHLAGAAASADRAGTYKYFAKNTGQSIDFGPRPMLTLGMLK